MTTKKLCIVCDAPLHSTMYTAIYCGECRSAVSAIKNRVSRHVKYAKLPPATDYQCADCGKPAKEYDHRFYSLPLEIEPVCVGCNQRRGPARDIVEMVRSERGMIDWQDSDPAMVAALKPKTAELLHPKPEQPEQPVQPVAADKQSKTLPQILEEAEHRFIMQALERTRWNATKAARLLGITFRAIRYRMKILGIKR